MAAVQITFNIAGGVWDDYVAQQTGATVQEQTLAAKLAIKQDFIKPAVLGFRIRAKQEALNAELRTYTENQTARLID